MFILYKNETPTKPESFYISAPVLIDGVLNKETVLVRRNKETYRIYLHSVLDNKTLLNRQVSSTDAEAVQNSGSNDSEDALMLIQELLKVNKANLSRSKSQTDNNDIRFSRTNKGKPLSLKRVKAFDLGSDTRPDKFIRTVQDKNIDLKRIQQQVTDTIKEFGDRINT